MLSSLTKTSGISSACDLTKNRILISTTNELLGTYCALFERHRRLVDVGVAKVLCSQPLYRGSVSCIDIPLGCS